MSLRMRRGGTPDSPPSIIFGPINGAQSVRDGVGTRTVTSPGGGVSFNSASNINTLITNNPSNTVFIASATGTYNNFRGISYSNKHPRFYFPGAAASYSITGAGSLNEIGMNGNTNGLEIHGGTWTGYGTTASAFGSSINAVGSSIVEDAVFTNAGQSGLVLESAVAGVTNLVSHCHFTTNGRYNITSNPGGTTNFQNTTLEYSLLENGNSALNDPGGDAGCMKMGFTSPFTMRYCWSKGNHGFGVWVDGRNRNAFIHNNVIENNFGHAPIPGAGGLFYEVGAGGVVIEHNYIIGNGSSSDGNYPFNGVQLAVSCSPSDGTGVLGLDAQSEIRYNDIDANAGFRSPIVLYNHTSHADVFRTRKWYIHHNRLWSRGASGQSRTGLSDQCSPGQPKEGDIGTSPAAPGLNLFNFNEYHVADINGSYWNHDTSSGSPGARTFLSFQSRQHEANGTVVAI